MFIEKRASQFEPLEKESKAKQWRRNMEWQVLPNKQNKIMLTCSCLS